MCGRDLPGCRALPTPQAGSLSTRQDAARVAPNKLLQGDRKGRPYYTRLGISVVYGRGGDMLDKSALYSPRPGNGYDIMLQGDRKGRSLGDCVAPTIHDRG